MIITSVRVRLRGRISSASFFRLSIFFAVNHHLPRHDVAASETDTLNVTGRRQQLRTRYDDSVTTTTFYVQHRYNTGTTTTTFSLTHAGPDGGGTPLHPPRPARRCHVIPPLNRDVLLLLVFDASYRIPHSSLRPPPDRHRGGLQRGDHSNKRRTTLRHLSYNPRERDLPKRIPRLLLLLSPSSFLFVS